MALTGGQELARLRAGYQEWRIYHIRDAGAYVAWLPGEGLSSCRRDTTAAGLRAQLEKAHQEET